MGSLAVFGRVMFFMLALFCALSITSSSWLSPSYSEPIDSQSNWGTFGLSDGNFNTPSGIAIDSSGNVYVADTANNRIQKFTGNGTFLSKWGSDGRSDGKFTAPAGIATDSSGNVYVADSGNSRIQKFSSNGTYIAKWGGYGTANGKFIFPVAVAVDFSDNVYVADALVNKIQKFSKSGQFISNWGTFGLSDGNFNTPSGIAIDSSGNVYVADSGNSRIQKFSINGTFLSKWGSDGRSDGKFTAPAGIATDSSGNVYVADTANNRIQKFTGNGTFRTEFGGYGAIDGLFNAPNSLTTDSSGNVYVADTDNNRIQKFPIAAILLSEGFGSNPQTVVLNDSSHEIRTISNSAIRTFMFDTEARQVTLQVENSESVGITLIQLGNVLSGPYVVSINGETIDQDELVIVHGTIPEESGIIFRYPTGSHTILIIGTSVVPEFPRIWIPLVVSILLLGSSLIVKKVRQRTSN